MVLASLPTNKSKVAWRYPNPQSQKASCLRWAAMQRVLLTWAPYAASLNKTLPPQNFQTIAALCDHVFLIDLFVGTYRLSIHARLEAFVIQTKLNYATVCHTHNQQTAPAFPSLTYFTLCTDEHSYFLTEGLFLVNHSCKSWLYVTVYQTHNHRRPAVQRYALEDVSP